MLDVRHITIDRISKDDLQRVDALNYELFREKRIINRTDHDFLVILTANVQDIPVGFKIGYGRKDGEFYSAKGGVLPNYRRQKLAEQMLDKMIDIATSHRFSTFTYDTFPNNHPGMLILGLKKGFRVSYAGYNTRYSDYQVTLTMQLNADPIL